MTPSLPDGLRLARGAEEPSPPGAPVWTLHPCFAPPPTANTAWVLDLRPALLDWNAAAKHRFRTAGWAVQGGLTYHTLDLVRAWLRQTLAATSPVAVGLGFPPWARFPDLDSPNACLIASCLLPVLAERSTPLLVWTEAEASPTAWEPPRPALPDALPSVLAALATAAPRVVLLTLDGQDRVIPCR